MFALSARSIYVATPPMVTSSRSSSCFIPITSIDIWQAINSTPFSRACWRKDSSESIPFLFMIYRIIFPPIPPMLILESFSFLELEGSIIPNIFPKISFSVSGLCNFLITFSPQKVKKMVTFCPVAAAPFASTKVAKALSKSSLNMMKVFLCPHMK